MASNATTSLQLYTTWEVTAWKHPSLVHQPPPEKSEGSGQLSVVDSYQRPDIGAPIRTLCGLLYKYV